MRIGLIGDIHEDFKSLKEALRQLERRHCDELICLGDIVGYDVSCDDPQVVRKPSACIEAVRSDCRHAVVGNHDLYAIRKLPAPTPAFQFPPDWYQLPPDRRRALAHGQVWLHESESLTTRLKRSEKRYLDSLPEQLVLAYNELTIHFSHSVHPDLTGSLMLHPHNPWELREHLQTLRQNRCAYGFSGHQHPDGLLIGLDRDIRRAPFGRMDLEPALTQYSCPGIARGHGRRGYAILDCVALTVETFRLGEDENMRRKWYERLIRAH